MEKKVSIAMITYNHEKLVGEAIQSVVMQETDFEYELVIGEDCSSDRTREIVIGFQQKHPDIIRLLLPEKNLGMMRNFTQTLNACTGKYIAILEGDDFWNSPHKLRKQVVFLDAHPECSICFNKTLALNEHDNKKSYIIPPPDYERPFLELKDLLKLNFIATPSVMYRNGLFGNFPEWYFELGMGDYPLHILNAQHGKIGYIPELMSIYRMHSGSTFSSRKVADNLRSIITFYEVINKHLAFKYDSIIQQMIRYYQMLLKQHE